MMIKDLGNIIENRRKQLGISRERLANDIGVTPQTIINIEKSSDYNIGTKILTKLESALNVKFIINIKENSPMEKINYGNDEAILYIRKNYPECTIDNRVLGKLIWEWLQKNANGTKLYDDEPQKCYWGEIGEFVDEMKLPKTATQFQIDRTALPNFYTFLDYLGQNQKTDFDNIG